MNEYSTVNIAQCESINKESIFAIKAATMWLHVERCQDSEAVLTMKYRCGAGAGAGSRGLAWGTWGRGVSTLRRLGLWSWGRRRWGCGAGGRLRCWCAGSLLTCCHGLRLHAWGRLAGMRAPGLALLLVLNLLEVLLASSHLSVLQLLHVERLAVGEELLPLVLQLHTQTHRNMLKALDCKKADYWGFISQKRPLTASLSLSMMVSSSSKCRSFISSFFIWVSTNKATRDLIFLSSTAARCCEESGGGETTVEDEGHRRQAPCDQWRYLGFDSSCSESRGSSGGQVPLSNITLHLGLPLYLTLSVPLSFLCSLFSLLLLLSVT